jgi:hypothetical protein
MSAANRRRARDSLWCWPNPGLWKTRDAAVVPPDRPNRVMR